MQSDLTRPKERLAQSFWVALAVAGALFLPFILADRGYFIFYGDFNVQQIPFYQLAHDSIRSGNIFWGWQTDLGANFIGSYSFYLLGSPFFWLTLPFPSAAVPYLMGPLLILKFACASTTAYLLARRFVRPDFALIAGLLYAFSGFSVYNVFFNHFHEAIIYFPLMLWALEKFMVDNQRGWFAVTVFLSALSNYYFFIGQVIFIVIYWIIRMGSPEWDCSLKKFFWLFFESVIGTAMAGVLLLPSFFAVIQNPRTDSTIGGWDFLIYNKPQRLFDILHSFFFPQDIPARPNFFPDSDNKWASMSAWLPVFSCSGAIAYFQSRRHTDWLHRMLIIVFFCAVIPGLNAMFQLFNAMYYARWYYMLVMILVLATVKCFEEDEYIPVNWKRAMGWTAGITAAFALFIGLMPESFEPGASGKVKYGLMLDPARFWAYVAVTAISLLAAVLLIRLFRSDKTAFFRWGAAAVCCVSLVYGWMMLGLGKGNSNYPARFVIERGIEGKDKISLPEDGQWSRVDINEGMDNQAMFWQLPTIQAFHSIVPGSIMEFYPMVGVTRSVGSRPEPSHYALRGLLSVRWLFDYANEDGMLYWEKQDSSYFQNPSTGTYRMPGFTYYDQQNGFSIYENQYYIPMGFTYDAVLTRSKFEEMSGTRRELSLLKALILEDEDAARLSQILPALDTAAQTYNQQAYLEDCLDRKATAASSFITDNRGFTATIDLPRENFVFFSVPYEEGWTATVNGQKAEILKANIGFMAVLCPAGEGEPIIIRFEYHTPGLRLGLLLTGGAAVLLALYLLLLWWGQKRQKKMMGAGLLEGKSAHSAGEPETSDTESEEALSDETGDSGAAVSGWPDASGDNGEGPAASPLTPPLSPEEGKAAENAALDVPIPAGVDTAPSHPADRTASPTTAEDDGRLVKRSSPEADDDFDLYRYYPGTREGKE